MSKIVVPRITLLLSLLSFSLGNEQSSKGRVKRRRKVGKRTLSVAAINNAKQKEKNIPRKKRKSRLGTPDRIERSKDRNKKHKPSLPNTSKNKSVEFVDIIKEDLRRNNDDYADALAQYVSKPNPESTLKPNITDVSKTDLNDKLMNEPDTETFSRNLRRSHVFNNKREVEGVYNTHNTKNGNGHVINYASISNHLPKKVLSNINIAKNNEAKFTRRSYYSASPVADVVKIHKLIHHDESQNANVKLVNGNVPQKRASMSKSENHKALIENLFPKNADKQLSQMQKMDNFKQLFQNNKQMIKDLMNKRKNVPIEKITEPTHTEPKITKPKKIEIKEPELSAVGSELKPKNPLLRTKAESDEEESDFKPKANLRYYMGKMGENNIPNSEQLDMAHAKGGRIHRMRDKGHLCHRHVLIPEGPKYDSKGKVYLAAYTRKAGRDYSQTKPPDVLLPRCCNCCKKSVLGCE